MRQTSAVYRVTGKFFYKENNVVKRLTASSRIDYPNNRTNTIVTIAAITYHFSLLILLNNLFIAFNIEGLCQLNKCTTFTSNALIQLT